MEAGDHPEKAWARTARGPVHVGVFVWTGVAQFAVGADIVDGQNIFAGRPESSAVPAKAALQQEAAKPYAPTMAGERTAFARRGAYPPRCRGSRGRPSRASPEVDGNRIQTR